MMISKRKLTRMSSGAAHKWQRDNGQTGSDAGVRRTQALRLFGNGAWRDKTRTGSARSDASQRARGATAMDLGYRAGDGRNGPGYDTGHREHVLRSATVARGRDAECAGVVRLFRRQSASRRIARVLFVPHGG